MTTKVFESIIESMELEDMELIEFEDIDTSELDELIQDFNDNLKDLSFE